MKRKEFWKIHHYLSNCIWVMYSAAPSKNRTIQKWCWKVTVMWNWGSAHSHKQRVRTWSSGNMTMSNLRANLQHCEHYCTHPSPSVLLFGHHELAQPGGEAPTDLLAVQYFESGFRSPFSKAIIYFYMILRVLLEVPVPLPSTAIINEAGHCVASLPS